MLVSQRNDLRTDLFDHLLNMAKARECVLSFPVLYGVLTSSSLSVVFVPRLLSLGSESKLEQDSKGVTDGRRGELELPSSLSLDEVESN